MRWAALVSYDGSQFHGFSVQPNGISTVGGSLATALGVVFQSQIELVVAGRTDKGVHAVGQVVSFDADAPRSDRLVKSLNRLLPTSVRVHKILEVEDSFSARFSAKYRCYLFRVSKVGSGSPFLESRAWQVGELLDVKRMCNAAGSLVGSHDFKAFCKSGGRDGRPTRRNLHGIEILESETFVDIVLWSNSFCHQMVRSIVSLLVDVGIGRYPGVVIRQAIVSGDRSMLHSVAPPSGLYLFGVGYEPFNLEAKRVWLERINSWSFSGPDWVLGRV